MEHRTGVIYKIKNKTNGKIYIGQTVNFHKRILRHKRAKESDSPLYRAIEKYGWENFEVEKIVEGDFDEKELDRLEIEYIKQFNSLIPGGYNLTAGGSGHRGRSAYVMTDEIKRKISQKLTGLPSRMKGIKRSEQSKMKMSMAHFGKKLSEWHKKRQGESRKGKPSGMAGKKQSDKWRSAMKIAHVGKRRPPFSDEWRANIGKASKGRKTSEETKKKQSVALKRFWETKRMKVGK